MDSVQGRIEYDLEQTFEDWTVVECIGDSSRKCIAKVRSSPGEFVHIYCSRDIRSDPWNIAYDPYKSGRPTIRKSCRL